MKPKLNSPILPLRILTAKITESKTRPDIQVRELEIEQTLTSLLSSSSHPPSQYSKEDREYTKLASVILLRKYSQGIETLVMEILKLLKEVWDAGVDSEMAKVVILESTRVVKEEKYSLEPRITGLKMLRKVISTLRKESLLEVTPMVLSLYIQVILGRIVKKDAIMIEGFGCLEEFIQKWTLDNPKSIQETVAWAVKVRNARERGDKVPESDATSNIHQQIYSQLSLSLSQLSSILDKASLALLRAAHSLSTVLLHSLPPGRDPLTSSIIPEVLFQVSSLSQGNLPLDPAFVVGRLQGLFKQFSEGESDVDPARCMSYLLMLEKIAETVAAPRQLGSQETLNKESLEHESNQQLSSSFKLTIMTEIESIGLKKWVDTVSFKITSIEIENNLSSNELDAEELFKKITPDKHKEMIARLKIHRLSSVRDYLPRLHFEKNLVEKFLEVFAKLLTRRVFLSMLCYLEEFVSFVDGLPGMNKYWQGQAAQKSSATNVGVGSFNNQLRKYECVETPIADLCGVLLLFVSGLASEFEIEEDFDRVFAALDGVQRVAEVYIQSSGFGEARGGVLKRIIKGLCAESLYWNLERQTRSINKEDELPVSLIRSTSYGILSGGSDEMATVLRCACAVWGEESLGAYLDKECPGLISRSSTFLQRSPHSPLSLPALNLLLSLAKLAPSSRLPLTLTPVLLKLTDLFPANLPHLSTLFLLILQMSSDPANPWTHTLSSMIRILTLKIAHALPKGNNLTRESVFKCLEIICTKFHKIPCEIEEKGSTWSANEPQNCVIDDTAGVIFVEIWPILIDEMKRLTNYVVSVESTIANFVYEFSIMRSKTRENYLKVQLKQLLERVFDKVTQDGGIKIDQFVTSIQSLSNLFRAPLPTLAPNPATPSPPLAILSLIRTVSATLPTVFAHSPRLTPILPPLLLLLFPPGQSLTTPQIKCVVCILQAFGKVDFDNDEYVKVREVVKEVLPILSAILSVQTSSSAHLNLAKSSLKALDEKIAKNSSNN